MFNSSEEETMTVKVFFEYQSSRHCPFVAYAWINDKKVEEFSSASFEIAERDLLAMIQKMSWDGVVPEPKEVEV